MYQKTQILKYSHFFVVRHPSGSILPVIYQLASQYTQFGFDYNPHTRKQEWKPIKTYTLYIENGVEFRFHIGQWPEFYDMLERHGVQPGEYELEVVPLKEPRTLPLKVRSHWKLRDEQREAVEFIKDMECACAFAPMINISMGLGKTTIALHAAAELGYRFGVIVLAKYVDKWVDDICEVLELEKSDIGVVKGGDLLQRTTLYPSSGRPIPSAFVFSMPTLAAWYKTYAECRDHASLEGYECRVDELMEHLGIGTVIFDEVHEHPHVIYMTNCHLHVKKTINLSATLLAKDPTIQKIQAKMFPRERRFDSIQMKRYILCHACAYQIMNFNQSKIVTKEHGRTTYSQTAYEKSLIRNKKLFPQYVGMVLDLIHVSYLDGYQPGDKLIVFVGSAKMALAMVAAIKARWPNYDTRTYLEGDPYENVIEPDIRVTTIISGGTAVDIKGLTTAIMTNAIDSPISNVQALGRLREIPGRDVKFYYFYCTSIPKHIEYHERKQELFRLRVKEQKLLFLDTLYP